MSRRPTGRLNNFEADSATSRYYSSLTYTIGEGSNINLKSHSRSAFSKPSYAKTQANLAIFRSDPSLPYNSRGVK